MDRRSVGIAVVWLVCGVWAAPARAASPGAGGPAVGEAGEAGPRASTPRKPQGLRGGAFELTGVGGVAVWDRDIGLKPCGWYGGAVGHRFEPLAERFHLGFRAGWEGCVTEQQVTGARIDMILIDVAFTWGIKLAEPVLVYGLTGGGFLLADSTPSGGQPYPRTCFQGGGGVALVLARYLYVDVSARVLAFENIQFGGFGGLTGTTASPLFTLALGGHI